MMSEENGAIQRATRNAAWRSRLLAGLALVGVLVLVALIAIQIRTDQSRDAAIDLQAHTYDVIVRASALSATTARAEASLGRYVVSGQKRLGVEFSRDWQRASLQLDRLATLTRDNPEQQRRIAVLRTIFAKRGAELAGTALYSVHDRDRDAWGSYFHVSESAARKALERQIGHIVDAERMLLAQRKREAATLIASSNFATRILGFFGILIVGGSALLGWMTIQALSERAAAEAEADSARERAIALEAAVADATAQLRAEAQERAGAEAQLRQAQKLDAVGQLTGGIAHDFNNMLAVVLGGLELARRRIQSGGNDTLRHIDNAMEGANRAAALTRRLLAFARSEPLLAEAVAPGELIAGMRDLLDRTLGDGVHVETRDTSDGWRVWTDRHQLENAILNLAVNARDAMDERGTITMTTDAVTLGPDQIGHCAPGDYAAICVRDTGSGMSPDIVERVFEPFFTTKPVGKGTGLGLSQIFGFVRQSGGEITIDTAPGEGTTISVYLPRYRGEFVAATDGGPTPDNEIRGDSLTILVVEDDPRVLAATLSALGELGHRATGCDDPRAAPAILATMEAPDLILSDVVMPEKSGPEMIAELPPRDSPVPVLFVTGYAREAEAQAFGDHPVLRKPFTMAALARAVDEAARAGYRVRRGADARFSG